MFVFISGLNLRKKSEKREEIMKVIFSHQQTEVHVCNARLRCARLGHAVL